MYERSTKLSVTFLLATLLISGFTIRQVLADEIRTVRVGDLERRYRLHLPKDHDKAAATPVVIAFHGGGGNPESMVNLGGLNEKSDEAGFAVVYPFGTSKLFQDRFLTFNGGECCGHAMQNNVDDVAMVEALLDDLATYITVDAKRVFATGLSNGGIMSYYLAANLSERIAAIAPVGGPMMLETCDPKRPVSVIHFHGTADRFAPFEGGAGQGIASRNGTRFRSVEHSLKCWIEANGCDKEPVVEQLPDKADDGMRVTRKTYGNGRNGSEVVLIEIEGGGHTWPGVEPRARFLGESTKDISANDLMWEFFQKHPLP